MTNDRLRNWISVLRRTPFHPQWMLGKRAVSPRLRAATGVVLDIGAGDKWLKSELSSEAQYISIDYPPTGRELYKSRPDIFADAASLPVADSTVDVVSCLEVLEHVADPLFALKEIARVLKISGVAYVSMPFIYPLHDAPYDFQRITEFGLRRDAERAGLEISSLKKTGHAVKVGGLIMCLALAGGVQSSNVLLRLILLPLAAIMVLAINLFFWVIAAVWPDWPNAAFGYEMELTKR